MDDQDFGDVKLTEGIELVKSNDDIPLGRSMSSMSLPEDPDTRESEIDSMLVERVARFFGTHTLQFKVPRESIEDMQRSLEEGKIEYFWLIGKAQNYCVSLGTLFFISGTNYYTQRNQSQH